METHIKYGGNVYSCINKNIPERSEIKENYKVHLAVYRNSNSKLETLCENGDKYILILTSNGQSAWSLVSGK